MILFYCSLVTSILLHRVAFKVAHGLLWWTIFRGQVSSTPVLILQLYGKNWYVTRNIRNNEAPEISCTRIKVGLQ